MSSFYKISFEDGKLELNAYTQIMQPSWGRVWKHKSNLLEGIKQKDNWTHEKTQLSPLCFTMRKSFYPLFVQIVKFIY